RRGRRLAFPLRPRQRAADVDASAPSARLRAAIAGARRAPSRPTAAVRGDVNPRRFACRRLPKRGRSRLSRSSVACKGELMGSKIIVMAAVAIAGSLACQVAAAQASSPTRADVKAETSAANKAGELAGPGVHGPSGPATTG